MAVSYEFDVVSSLKVLVTTVSGGTSPLLWTASNITSYSNSYSPVHVAGLLPKGSTVHDPFVLMRPVRTTLTAVVLPGRF